MKDFSLQPSRRCSAPESTSQSGKEGQGKAECVEVTVKIIKMEKKPLSFLKKNRFVCLFISIYIYNDESLKTMSGYPEMG